MAVKKETLTGVPQNRAASCEVRLLDVTGHSSE